MPVIKCDKCGAECIPSGCTSGYGVTPDGDKHCFNCCADNDRESMDATGKAIMYLTLAVKPLPPRYHEHFTYISKECGLCRRGPDGSYGKVANWPGTLSYPVHYAKAGLHNIAGTRYDIWFKDHAGRQWYGVQYGDNTQLCHCRRLKEKGA